MLFLTQDDIDKRRLRGFEERNLYSEPSQSRVEKAKRIVVEIENAFLGVRLEDGIGLFEGQAIDNYDTAEERAHRRAKDEEEDWKRIQSKHINACYSSLSFFDPKGMRFHLPAFICCELRGEYDMGLDISLSEMDEWKKSKFTLLSSSQRKAVAKFLQFLAEDVDSEFSRSAIEKDLVEYWM